ncbi:hypothetical protein, partial [Salmonella enterica]|uniref:hypothetical protein n=1 Tax=Salmonella enterica TaxID=28901 RepID=UPI0032987CA9
APPDVPRHSLRVERHRPDPDGYREADVGERHIREPRRTDELVEQRPYVEDVVVRRRAADAPAGTDRAAEDLRRDRLDDRRP